MFLFQSKSCLIHPWGILKPKTEWQTTAKEVQKMMTKLIFWPVQFSPKVWSGQHTAKENRCDCYELFHITKLTTSTNLPFPQCKDNRATAFYLVWNTKDLHKVYRNFLNDFWTICSNVQTKLTGLCTTFQWSPPFPLELCYIENHLWCMLLLILQANVFHSCYISQDFFLPSSHHHLQSSCSLFYLNALKIKQNAKCISE